MDEDTNRYARELIHAINAAMARSPEVQRCRAQARAAGIELQVLLEARGVARGKGKESRARRDEVASSPARQPDRVPQGSAQAISESDRRFLRSLRITADLTPEPVEE